MLWFVAVFNTLVGCLAVTNGLRKNDAKEAVGGCLFLAVGIGGFIEVLS